MYKIAYLTDMTETIQYTVDALPSSCVPKYVLTLENTSITK